MVVGRADEELCTSIATGEDAPTAPPTIRDTWERPWNPRVECRDAGGLPRASDVDSHHGGFPRTDPLA